MTSTDPKRVPKILRQIISALLPEYKYLATSPGKINYQGVMDYSYLKTIQKDITSRSLAITLTDLTYENGNTLIHYKINPSLAQKKISDSAIKPSHQESDHLTLTAFQAQLDSCSDRFHTDSQQLPKDVLQSQYLGKKGLVNDLTKLIPKLPKESRGAAGKLINTLKQDLQKQISQHLRSTIEDLRSNWIDVTAPGDSFPTGHLHPISQAIDEITRIFNSIGFTRFRYPEVDWDWYVFGSLNMPAGHPARDEWETFFVDALAHSKKGQMVLTTHTSNGQVREMERLGTPPIRMINIAKCYRRQQDVTHTPVFHQFEGLVVDHGISIAHLKGTIDYFARHFYGPKAKSRIRPFHFQFTEPSFEVDFSCTLCNGRGCKFCKSGWHEVGGAGMVHPNVLKAGGIDPTKYTGFAFGWGVERTYTLKPGLKVDDIRLFYNNNLDFLTQFQ